MSIFRIEVHSKNRQVEHYIVPDCESETEAMQRIKQFYADLGLRLGLWDKEVDRLDNAISYLIFDIEQLPPNPVVYIAGEYRSQYPI